MKEEISLYQEIIFILLSIIPIVFAFMFDKIRITRDEQIFVQMDTEIKIDDNTCYLQGYKQGNYWFFFQTLLWHVLFNT